MSGTTSRDGCAVAVSFLELTPTMSQPNPRPNDVFRTSLKDWQAAFRAKKAQLAAILGDDEPAPAAPIREKKMANRKRRAAKA